MGDLDAEILASLRAIERQAERHDEQEARVVTATQELVVLARQRAQDEAEARRAEREERAAQRAAEIEERRDQRAGLRTLVQPLVVAVASAITAGAAAWAAMHGAAVTTPADAAPADVVSGGE
jgi:putative heme iron utilization protein